MAFEVPDHLPRGGLLQDKPFEVLAQIGNATQKSLNASLAASCLAELDSAIRDTRSRIFQRIHDDLPSFEQQLESSRSIQSRLRELSTTVQGLSNSLNDPETGILPTLLQTLTAHASLSAQADEYDITHHALVHLLQIWESFHELSTRLQRGELPESAKACIRVQNLITATPPPLDRAEIMDDIRKRYRTLSDRLQEQLNDAYARCVVFSATDDNLTLEIFSHTRVLPTSTLIALPAILESLVPDSVSAHLSSFRRDFMGKIVDSILISSREIKVTTSDSSSMLSVSLSTSSSFGSLRTALDFLHSHFFPALTQAQASFPATFHSPLTTALLTHVLEPSIPSSISTLPGFLETVDKAVQFEDALLSAEIRDRPINQWTKEVAVHYEKSRRESFLRMARDMVILPEDGITLRIEVAVKQPENPPIHETSDGTNPDVALEWEFDEEITEQSTNVPALSEEQLRIDHPTPVAVMTPDDEVDETDGWGWGDDVDDEMAEAGPSQGETAEAEAQKSDEEDPWDDDTWTPNPITSQETKLELAPKPMPRTATRLEKFSTKTKGLNTVDKQTSSQATPETVHSSPDRKVALPPPQVGAQSILEQKETYLVSSRARHVLNVAEKVMQEGQELLQSSVFAKYSIGRTAIPGQLLIATAPSVLDLHRALYPTSHSSLLSRDPNLAMRWSNDCKFLSDNAAKLRHDRGSTIADDKWVNTEDRLRKLGELCFEDAVVRQQEVVGKLLKEAQGFVEITQRFEEYSNVIQRILQNITSVALQWKETLTRSGYFRAMGQVVDDALFRVMDHVLSLEDIPEADSVCLSDLCESLGPLEEVFVYSPGEGSVVASHVSLWFKFSYLSWLIKGSIADLSYLFDEGMLVDYGIEELIKLVRALFADTPLRENTIAKIARGHPPPNNSS